MYHPYKMGILGSVIATKLVFCCIYSKPSQYFTLKEDTSYGDKARMLEHSYIQPKHHSYCLHYHYSQLLVG